MCCVQICAAVAALRNGSQIDIEILMPVPRPKHSSWQSDEIDVRTNLRNPILRQCGRAVRTGFQNRRPECHPRPSRSSQLAFDSPSLAADASALVCPSPCQAFPRVSWGWTNQQLRLTAFCPWMVTDRLDGGLVNPPFSARSQYRNVRLGMGETGR
jgi:hypothetical protein